MELAGSMVVALTGSEVASDVVDMAGTIIMRAVIVRPSPEIKGSFLEFAAASSSRKINREESRSPDNSN